LNEPELLMTLRSRYQRSFLSTYYGQVLLHFNPMRVGGAEEETHSEADEVLERFALDVRNHTGMAPGAWEIARKFVQSQTGSLGTYECLHLCLCRFHYAAVESAIKCHPSKSFQPTPTFG
jgi:hypothetical protein